MCVTPNYFPLFCERLCVIDPLLLAPLVHRDTTMRYDLYHVGRVSAAIRIIISYFLLA